MIFLLIYTINIDYKLRKCLNFFIFAVLITVNKVLLKKERTLHEMINFNISTIKEQWLKG